MKNRETYGVGAGIIFIMVGALILVATGHHISGPGDVPMGITLGGMVISLGGGIVIGARGSRREG
jgi:hypothetical protein